MTRYNCGRLVPKMHCRGRRHLVGSRTGEQPRRRTLADVRADGHRIVLLVDERAGGEV